MVGEGIEVRTDGGITRAVLLIGRYAIKAPRVRYGWDKFLLGLLSNMQEGRFSVLAKEFALAPTVFSLPGGWLNIQRRCDPLTDAEWDEVEARCGQDRNWGDMSCDFKRDNFGTIDGQIVLLDYGEVT